MKLSNLFLIGAIAFGLAACNNENVPDVQQQDGTLSLRITQSGVSSVTKATGAAADIAKAESFIHSLDVFVINVDDAVEAHARVEATAGTALNRVEGIPVKAGSRTIVVVANSLDILSSITSKTDLMAIIATDLADQTLADGLLMTSAETAAIDILPGKNYYGYPEAQADAAANFAIEEPLQLERVVARVALTGVSVAFVAPYTSWTYEIENVFLYNAKKQSNYFGTSLVQGTEFLSGLDLKGFSGQYKPSNWIPDWTTNYLIDTVAVNTTITANEPVYYYTFENDNVVSPTCISLRGRLIDPEEEYVTLANYPYFAGVVDKFGYTYFTVIVNATREGYSYPDDDPDNPGGHDATIKRNTQYNIKLNVNRLGVDDPTVIIDPADLNVEVEVTPWVLVNQEVVW